MSILNEEQLVSVERIVVNSTDMTTRSKVLLVWILRQVVHHYKEGILIHIDPFCYTAYTQELHESFVSSFDAVNGGYGITHLNAQLKELGIPGRLSYRCDDFSIRVRFAPTKTSDEALSLVRLATLEFLWQVAFELAPPDKQ